jgi:hypothetical protein
MACNLCKPHGGLFRLVMNPKTGVEGMERCDCEDAARVARVAERRQNPVALEPVLTDQQAGAFVLMLAGVVPFFPGDSISRAPIGKEIQAMCESKEDALWLVQEMGRRWDEWKGIRAMRRLYCKRSSRSGWAPGRRRRRSGNWRRAR